MSWAHDAYEGWRVVRRRRQLLLLLGLCMAVTTFALSLFLGDVLTEVQSMKDGQSLRARHAVSFSAFYPPGQTSGAGRTALPVVTQILESKPAYSLVVQNMGAARGSADDGVPPPVVVFGEAFHEVFPSIPSCNPPCALVGVSAAEKYRTADITVAGERVPVRGSIDEGVSMLDPNSRGIPLGQRVVVYLPVHYLSHLDSVEGEEAVSRLVVLGAKDADVAPVVAAASRGGLNLVPHFLGIEESLRFRDIMTRSAICILAAVAFFAASMTASFLTLSAVFSAERSALAIRRMVGATQAGIGVSIVVASLTFSLLLPAIALMPLVALEGPWRQASLWLLLANSLIAASISAHFVRTLGDNNFEAAYR